MTYSIPFNKPYIPQEKYNVFEEVFKIGKFSGNGKFTTLCHEFFEKKYSFNKCLLTTSCSDALEMCAILADIKSGDEIIIPSFNFVSSANAFELRGGKVVFADTNTDDPNINIDEIEKKITSKTKAVVIVHYAGMSCDMKKLKKITKKYNLLLIEDAAHAIDSFYIENRKKVPLGRFGDLATFSFHETKNINSGEGGMLVINNKNFIKRAEIIWEKGTNRKAFFRGEVNKYEWVDIGSSFLPSEITAAFLYSNLLEMDLIQNKRIKIFNKYYEGLRDLERMGMIVLPKLKDYQFVNGHIFYFLTKSKNETTKILDFLKSNGVDAAFHYQCLHSSQYYLKNNKKESLINSEKFSDQLIRLPLYFDLSENEINYIVKVIEDAYLKN